MFSDVDSAYEEVQSNIALLKPYRDKYKDQATRVRDTVTYSYQRGAASLMDFLNAQSDYRVVQLAYLQLVGAYMTSASQLNLAVAKDESGREANASRLSRQTKASESNGKARTIGEKKYAPVSRRLASCLLCVCRHRILRSLPPRRFTAEGFPSSRSPSQFLELWE